MRQKKIGAILLALVVAAGFYLYPPPWAPNALFVSVMVLGLCLKSGRFRFSFLFCYLASLFLFLMPLAVEFYFQGYGNHVRSLWAGPALFSSSHLFLVDLPYLFQIFWGGPHHQALYGPWWGGFLNPISTALFLFGAVELWTLRRIWIARGFFLAFVIFLIPGFFSNGVEMMRVENLIPVLLAVMALGTYALVLSLKPQWRIGLVVLFPLSFGLNFYHLAVPFANAARPASPYFAETRSDESYNAFQVIREKARKDGPGLLFLDFLHCPLDQTLYLATFPYNASMNPQLKDAKRTWAAFLTNINYVPFLKSQLPHAQWYVVNPQIDPWDGQLVLGVFALEDSNKTLVDRWSRAEQIF
ncbi:MAG TPA: hypothetical protein VN963_04705, partial [bacterium]|nr:hypothetical protein [bacterium]